MARRRYRKKKSVLIRSGEKATVERCHQLGGVVRDLVDRDAGGSMYVLCDQARIECMLDSYKEINLVSAHQREVGLLYRKHYLRGTHQSLAKSRFSSGARVSIEDSRVISVESQRFIKKADKVLTPAQRKIIIRVCCDDKMAGGTDALETLRRGLDSLDDYFRKGQRQKQRATIMVENNISES